MIIGNLRINQHVLWQFALTINPTTISMLYLVAEKWRCSQRRCFMSFDQFTPTFSNINQYVKIQDLSLITKSLVAKYFTAYSACGNNCITAKLVEVITFWKSVTPQVITAKHFVSCVPDLLFVLIKATESVCGKLHLSRTVSAAQTKNGKLQQWQRTEVV